MIVAARFGAIVLSGCALGAASVADAQTPQGTASVLETESELPKSNDENSGEIVVTAQRREQSVNNIGMAINVVSGADLAARRIDSLRDLTLTVPGLRFNDLGGGVPVYIVRGVGFNENSLMATSAVGIYQDDVALAFPVMARGPLYDLERTEVLKGPQGTLFGRNATGGALNFITRKPVDTPEAYAQASYGRFNTFELEGAASGAISESVRLRLAGKTIQASDGWQRSLSRDETLGRRDQLGLRATLVYEPSDVASLTARIDWWRDRSDTQAPTLVRINFMNPNNRPIADTFTRFAIVDQSRNLRNADWTRSTRPRFDQENLNLSLNSSFELAPDITLTSLTSYDRFDENGSIFNRDGFGGVPLAAPGVSDFIPTADLIGGYVPPPFLANAYYDNDGSIDAFAQELRLNGKRGLLTFVVGGYYSKDKVRSIIHLAPDFTTNTNNLGGNPRAGFNAIDYIANQDSESWSAFLHTEWAVTPTLNLIAAARYARDSSDFNGCSADVFGGVAAVFRVQRGQCITLNTVNNTRGALITKSLDEDSLSFRLGAEFKATPTLLLYGTFSRGYKPGSFPNLAATVDTQYDPVRQERLDAYEVGTKWSLPGQFGQLNLSAFYYDYVDRQLNTKVQTALGSLFALANIPQSTVKGIEGELIIRPLDGLQFNLNGVYLRTRVKDFTSFTQSGLTPVSFAGSEFPFIPRFQGAVSVSYTRPVGETLKLVFNSDLSYSDGFATDYTGPASPLDPTYRIDSYALVGISAGFARQDDRWRVTAWARNLTNTFYATNVFKNVDVDIRLNGLPRTYGVTVAGRF